jgi:hypothetical protein
MNYRLIVGWEARQRRGRFKHSAIIEGVKQVYFNGGKKTVIGNLAPCEDIISLREDMTAESVAWVCIVV